MDELLKIKFVKSHEDVAGLWEFMTRKFLRVHLSALLSLLVTINMVHSPVIRETRRLVNIQSNSLSWIVAFFEENLLSDKCLRVIDFSTRQKLRRRSWGCFMYLRRGPKTFECESWRKCFLFQENLTLEFCTKKTGRELKPRFLYKGKSTSSRYGLTKQSEAATGVVL